MLNEKCKMQNSKGVVNLFLSDFFLHFVLSTLHFTLFFPDLLLPGDCLMHDISFYDFR